MLVVHLVLKIDILKIEHAFQTGYREGDNFLHFTSQLEGVGGIPRVTHLLGVNIGCLKTRDLSLYCLSILTSSLFPNTFFCMGMGITSCKLGCLTLTIFMMMSPLGTSLLIPLSLIPFMGLLNSSLA